MIKYFLIFIFCIYLFTVTLNAKTNTQAIVFDFGGVIAKANTAQMAEFLKKSLNISENELKITFKNMQTYVYEGGSEKKFWENYTISKGKMLPKEWFNQFETVIRNAITEIPGTIAIVKELQSQGYTTAMLSDVTQYQANIIRKMGYYNLFNPVVLSYEIGVEKPNPEAFRKLLKVLKIPVYSVLFIDDKDENVESAKNQGIDAIRFVNPQQLKEELEKRGFDLHKVEDDYAVRGMSLSDFLAWFKNSQKWVKKDNQEPALLLGLSFA